MYHDTSRIHVPCICYSNMQLWLTLGVHISMHTHIYLFVKKTDWKFELNNEFIIHKIEILIKTKLR